MKKPEQWRTKKWPTVEEFWATEEPKPFRLLSSTEADYRKFRRWLRQHLRKIEDSDFDYDKATMEAFGDDKDIDICMGDFDTHEEINHDMAVFKWTNKEYMSKEEIKKLTDVQKKVPTPVEMFDLAKSERMEMIKADLKIQEIQAEQENLSNFI
jgi:hypothetical protein